MKMKYSGKFFQVFSSIFSLICIAAAVFFMVYCTVQYCRNEDSSVIRFAEYNKNKDNIYPGITLCFRDYFKPDTFGHEFELKIYKDFIDGNAIFENNFQKMAYMRVLERLEAKQMENQNKKQNTDESEEGNKIKKEKTNQKKENDSDDNNDKRPSKERSRKERSNVENEEIGNNEKYTVSADLSEGLTAEQEEIITNFTRKIEDIYKNNDVRKLDEYMIFGTMATYQPGMRVYHYPSNMSLGNTTWIPTFYPSFSSSRKRCWTFQLPFRYKEKIVSYGIMLNKSVFENSKRPAYKSFEVRLSYPGQQLTSPSVESNWGKKESKKEYTMKFEVQNIVVMKRRNKMKEACEEDWKKNDKVMIEKIMEDVKCTLPHWKMNSALPFCQKQQLTKIRIKFHQLRNNNPPCQAIEKILYTYDETDGLENFDETISESHKQLGIRYDISNIFQLMLTFQGSTYMEITQIRAYDGQSLIGNAGGYVGLFLGVALIQLPSAFQCLYRLLKKVLHTA